MPFGEQLTWPSDERGAVATKNIFWAVIQAVRAGVISPYSLPIVISLVARPGGGVTDTTGLYYTSRPAEY